VEKKAGKEQEEAEKEQSVGEEIGQKWQSYQYIIWA
jgi:hypothetical protein